jgi:putative ABC transport system permease protein
MIPFSYTARSLLVRKTTTLATLIGVGLVVFVLSAALMLSAGVEKTLASSGDPTHAVVIRDGSDAELASSIENSEVSLVLAAPGVKRDGEGNPIGAGEAVAVILLDKLGGDGFSNVMVRGVTPNVYTLRPFARVVEGRPARPGTDEVVIGKRIVGRFKGMEIGQQFELKKNRPVTVVGVIDTGGSSFESEVWGDVETVRSSFGRGSTVSSVTVVLEGVSKFEGFKTAVESNEQLLLAAEREDIFFEKQSEGLSFLISLVGWIITVFFMLAAMIGAFITMNTAVANRRREIGTMLALGFGSGAVLVAFVVEALVLGLLASVVGVLASLLMTFGSFSTINQATWSEIVFNFDLTASTAITATVVGTLIGLAGGFLPAYRASRVKPVEAMRG